MVSMNSFQKVNFTVCVHRQTEVVSSPCLSADTDIILLLVEGGLILSALEHERDVLVFDVVHELRVQVLRTDDVLLDVASAFLVAGLPIGGGLDVDLGLLEVLLWQLLQRNRADWGIGILLLESRVSDERRDVLLELSQVLDDVVLSEDDAVLIVLLLCNTKEELAKLEHVNHRSDVRLNLLKHLLGVVRIVLRFFNLVLEHLALVTEGLLQVHLFLEAQLASLVDLGDLLLDFLVALLQLVVLRVEHVHVVEQAVVLLLCLDESGDDFFDVGDTSRLLDLIESVFDDFDVPEVLLHQLSLLFVRLSDLVEPSLKDYDGIRKFGSLGRLTLLGVLLLTFLGVVVNQFTVFLVVETHLQLLDVGLEQILVLLMLGLERNDLIVGLLRNLGNGLVVLILLLRVLLKDLDLLVVSLALGLRRHELLPQQIDLLLQLLVSGLRHVQSDPLILHILVLGADLDLCLLLL